LQQQRRPHLPALYCRRYFVQLRLHDGEQQPAASAALRHLARRHERRPSASALGHIFQNSGEIAHELMEARCDRGAETPQPAGKDDLRLDRGIASFGAAQNSLMQDRRGPVSWRK
jgi:hypothetical protein